MYENLRMDRIEFATTKDNWTRERKQILNTLEDVSLSNDRKNTNFAMI